MDKSSFEANLNVMKQNSLGKYSILKGLYSAIDNNEFFLQYQPRINGKTNELVGMKALLRLQHPKYGLIYPSEFLPLAEGTGLIKYLDKWVLSNSCKQLKHWQSHGYCNLRIAINLSDWQFKQENFPELFKNILAETYIDASYIDIEIKETVPLKNQNLNLKTLGILANMGVKIIIGNFGSNSFSINYLKQLPAYYLKIDKTLIGDIFKDKSNLIIVKSFIDIAHALNLKVIAEGVETMEQLVLLQSMDCDELQGYFMSKPLTAEDAENQCISTHTA